MAAAREGRRGGCSCAEGASGEPVAPIHGSLVTIDLCLCPPARAERRSLVCSMSPRSSWALRRAAALAAGVATLPAVGCGAPDERTPGIYDPRVPVVTCLRDAGVPAHRVEPIAIVADGVRIDFLATPGAAEARQIAGAAQGAEQIGRALVWVDGAPDRLLATVEECVDR
jgi:hypothetical protein